MSFRSLISTTLKFGRKYAGSSTGTPLKNQRIPVFSSSALSKVPICDHRNLMK